MVFLALYHVKAMGRTSEFDWRHARILKAGETDGFKWYIRAFDFPGFLNSAGMIASGTNVVYHAYVDVSGTSLAGIVDAETVDELGINLFGGCAFAGPGENIALLRESKIDREAWFIGEDYMHPKACNSDPDITIEDIENHLKTETIPTLMKALIMVDLKHDLKHVQ